MRLFGGTLTLFLFKIRYNP